MKFSIKNFGVLFFGILTIFLSSRLQAQAKVILVWDEAQWIRPLPKNRFQAQPLYEGLKLQAGDWIQLDSDHNVAILKEDGSQIDLVGPLKYQIPQVSWDKVGYLVIPSLLKKQELKGGFSLPINATIFIEGNYELVLQKDNQRYLVITGPTEYKVLKSGLQIERFQPKALKIKTPDYSVLQDLVDLEGDIQIRRGTNYNPHPLLPRGKLRNKKEITFSWTAKLSDSKSTSTEYAFKIWSGANESLYQTRTSQTSLTISNLLMESGKNYRWTIGMIHHDKHGHEVITWSPSPKIWSKISVLSKEKQQELAKIEKHLLQKTIESPKSISSWWNLFLLYYNFELYSEALAVFHQQIKRFQLKPKKVLPILHKIGIKRLNLSRNLIEECFAFDLEEMLVHYSSLPEKLRNPSEK